MSERHFGLSIPTQRRLFAVHLAKTTDRPVMDKRGIALGLFFSAMLWVFIGLAIWDLAGCAPLTPQSRGQAIYDSFRPMIDHVVPQ